MTIGEKVSYIKGLAEGLALDESTKEGKVLAAIVDVLGDIAENLAEVDEELDDVADVMTDLEESVSDLEDDVYGYDEDEDEIVYTGNDLPDDEQIVRGSTDEILDAGFIIDEDSPEDIMNVFDDLEEDAGNGDEM